MFGLGLCQKFNVFVYWLSHKTRKERSCGGVVLLSTMTMMSTWCVRWIFVDIRRVWYEVVPQYEDNFRYLFQRLFDTCYVCSVDDRTDFTSPEDLSSFLESSGGVESSVESSEAVGSSVESSEVVG
ncbi:uncharacterized protein YALI1_C30726g [Yarrowia lipolytica]|uniref:Uncharacterized protein n=1 Tax=Yarrowia lipolytica TaxID=4952 RepID=A0A1D8NC94_YARLL|nr:hypothetical protein YALI1_C30726g [Yarrowia lipolytica]